ncbi:MAG TPA: T9SS type A sorting domain-containing protein, partial [Flavobacterium sp.]
TNALVTAQYEIAPGTVLPANLSGTYINFVPGARWSVATGKIDSQSGNNFTFQYRFRDARDNTTTFYKPRAGDIFYLWGKYELLDTPGEWFRKPDEEGGMLYLYFPPGVNPNNQVVEIKSAGENRNYAFWIFDRSHITIKNIKIRGAYISVSRTCSNITIDGVDVEYGDHATIIPYWYGGGAASINSSQPNTIIKNCKVAYSAGGGIAISGNDSKAINNVVHDTGYMGNGGSSVSATSGLNMELKNNTGWNVASANVIDFRFARDTKVWYNDASQSGKITFDGGMLMGAVYRTDTEPYYIPVYAEGTEIAYNYIHGGQGLSGGDFFGTSGIYFEGHLHDYVIHHNVIWNVGGGINMPDSNYSGFKIYNNTLYEAPMVLYNRPNIVNVEIKNNVFTRFVSGGDYHTTSSVLKNLTTLIDYRTSVYPDNIYAPNPQFTNPENLNFMPLAGSPLIDAGMELPPYTDRFLGTKPDIGAFESGKPTFIAGALVRPQDIANITVTYDNAAFPNKRFTVSGLPEGRKIDPDFKLKIGTAPSGGTMQYDYATNQVSFTNVPNGNLTGVQPISLDMGTEGVRATSSSIDLSNLSVYSIAVYPNPSKGEFFIRIPQEYQGKEVRVRVYALDGKLVLDKNLENNNADAVRLTAKGIYILKTTIEDQTFTNKIFVN